jgi:hypothetical protein
LYGIHFYILLQGLRAWGSQLTGSFFAGTFPRDLLKTEAAGNINLPSDLSIRSPPLSCCKATQLLPKIP